jgi:uncharacterized membrane protein YbaN (DUF454 family)
MPATSADSSPKRNIPSRFFAEWYLLSFMYQSEGRLCGFDSSEILAFAPNNIYPPKVSHILLPGGRILNTRQQVKPIVRNIYMLLGLLAAGCGSIGIVLPLLPTTPFFILSSWFLVKSSPRLHRWLAGTEAYQRTAGVFLTAGGLTITAKISILIPVLIMLFLMFFSVENIIIKALALVLAMVKTLVFIRIPTIPLHVEKSIHYSEKEEVV